MNALTKDEWAERKAEWGRYWVSLYEYGQDGPYHGFELQVGTISEVACHKVPDEMMHQAAALCLHGQEFGFTREDVRALRRVLEDPDRFRDQGSSLGPWMSDEMRMAVEQLHALADRIEALLPPEDE